MKDKIIKNNILLKILTIFVLLQPFLDTYILFDASFTGAIGFSPSTLIRYLFIMVLSILFVFTIKSKKKYVYYLVYGLMVIVYVILHHYYCLNMTTLFPNNFNYSLMQEIEYIIRLTVPLILMIIASNLNINKRLFNNVCIWLSLIISGVIVITNIFKISIGAYYTQTVQYNIFDWFNGIHNSVSFMYTATRGYFNYANLISSLLFGLTIYILYLVISECNFKNNICLILNFFAMFMLGTKVATLGMLICLIIMILCYFFFIIIKKERFVLKPFIIIVVLIGLWFVIYPYSPCYNRLNGNNNDNNKNNEVIEDGKFNKFLLTLNSLSEYDKINYSKTFIKENYKYFGIRKDYMFKKYSYEYDPLFWIEMYNEDTFDKKDNRFIAEKVLQRIEQNNTNNKTGVKLFGEGYSRMTNTIYLEKDFLSQYYTIGIIGILLFILPYILIPFISLFYILFNRKYFTFENISIIICIFASLAGAYFCGNTLDGLTWSIIYSFIYGYLISKLFKKNEKKLDEKKITIVALHLGTGGVEKYISSLCSMLEDSYKINIISSYKVSNTPGFYFSNKINIKYLINDRPYKNEFIKAVKDFNIKDIMKYGYKNLKILILKPIKEYKEIEKIDSKYVITTLFHNKIVNDILDENYIKIATEHNYHNNNKQYINKVITSCRNSDYLVCVSNELKDFYKGKLKNFKTKVVYIPNVIDKLPIIKKEHNKNTLIAVGRLAREKGFGDLIDIVNIIKNDIPNIKVNIVGDGYEKDELENKIINLNLEKNIFLLGKKTFEEVENLMQESYIYLMTSYTESFGLVLIEAMSNKICCIGFDTSAGAREILKDGNGILIENRDKSLFAKKVVELINDDKKYNLICNNAYKYCKIYLASNVKNSWLELLECKNEKIF